MQRYGSRSIQFVLDGPMREMTLPADLFDSVADNLIENALRNARPSVSVLSILCGCS